MIESIISRYTRLKGKGRIAVTKKDGVVIATLTQRATDVDGDLIETTVVEELQRTQIVSGKQAATDIRDNWIALLADFDAANV